MAKKRITIEKHQRDAKKKRKADEKRNLRQQRKEQAKLELDKPRPVPFEEETGNPE